MEALRADLREARRIGAHYAPRLLAELAAIAATVLFLTAVVAAAVMRGA